MASAPHVWKGEILECTGASALLFKTALGCFCTHGAALRDLSAHTHAHWQLLHAARSLFCAQRPPALVVVRGIAAGAPSSRHRTRALTPPPGAPAGENTDEDCRNSCQVVVCPCHGFAGA